MSRFRTTKEIKETKEGLKSGYVDIVVGTHKLLGKDIQYKDLGLLIVDEEQRFGVRHKNALKRSKERGCAHFNGDTYTKQHEYVRRS